MRTVRCVAALLICLCGLISLEGCGTGTAAAAAPTPGAPTVAITASPVASDGSVTLTVTATNATGITISDNVDSKTFTLAGTGGTQVVTPTQTTIYTATATGTGGTVTNTVTVTVGLAVQAPTVTVAAAPTTITSGGSSTLTVVATNANSVVITNNVNPAVTYTLPVAGGTQVVSPTQTTIYTATATGTGGTVTAMVTVTVQPVGVLPPTVTITAAPTTINSGGSSTLSVVATNASSVVITNNVNPAVTYTLPVAGGKQVVSPTQTTIYTATAIGGGQTVTATVTVTVNALPTVTITATPTTIAVPGSSTLSVTATNATSVVISDNVDSNTYPLAPTGGSQVVSPTLTTTYTATATGPGGTATATVTVTVQPTVTITATPTSVSSGGSSTLAVTATNATGVVITDNVDPTYSFALNGTGGSDTVTVTQTTVYTATATGAGGTATATATVTVLGTVQAVNHVLFLMQENRTFDTYFGMLNPYRIANSYNVGDDGKTYNVDGIEDKLSTTNTNDLGAVFKLFKTKSTCLDDMTSAWLESYGEVSRYNFTPQRPILMDGFVHVAENYAASGAGSGTFTDLAGQRAMAYYDEGFLNYYYYMASQFAVSDRWFSPVSSKSTPNRIATMAGGTTQGLVRDPFVDDKLPTLDIKTIFEQLDNATPPVSWKIYYGLAEGSGLPDTTFTGFGYSGKYLIGNPTHAACTPPLVPGNASNTFCIDPTHLAPWSQLFTDMANGTLPAFSYIEAEYGESDEHPGSGQSILEGQAQAANIIDSLMASKSWADSVFFLAYDEGGGPYDHVPPVPGSTNKFTDASLGITTDISSIAVNADSYVPCLANGPVDTSGNPTPTTHCDLKPGEPGTATGDAPALKGFAAQLGFRLPNMIVSPFTRKHFVSHTPMDHTAVLKFVESRFIGPTAHLTARDAAQPDLMEFFDFTNVPWRVAPTPPAPFADPSGSTCTPGNMGP